MARKNHAVDLLKEARRLSGLSQRAMAKRAGTAQSVVARIELGVASPSVETLARLLAAAGFELAPRLAPKPSLSPADLAESDRLKQLSPDERLASPTGTPAGRLDVSRVLAALGWHRVRYVLAGVLAARLQGMPRAAARMEIVPSHDVANLKALAAALRELDPKVHSDAVPEGLAFDCSAQVLGRAEAWDMETAAGRVAVVFVAPGAVGYDDLSRGATRVELGSVTVEVAGLADIARSVAAADRPEDRQDLFLLEHLLETAKI